MNARGFNKAAVLRLIICSVVLAACTAAHFRLARTAAAVNPHVLFSALRYDMGADGSVTYSQIEEAQLVNKAFRKELICHTDAGLVNAVITSDKYIRYADFHMLCGAFFTENAYKAGLDTAVVDEGLAFALFGTDDAVGNAFTLNGLTYTVCGVYRRDGLYEFFTGNGRPEVYIPAHGSVDRLYAADTAVQYVLFEQEIWEALPELADVSRNAANYKAADMNDAREYIEQWPRITLFAAGLCVFLLIARFIWRDARKRFAFVAGEYKSLTSAELLEKHGIYIMFGLVLIVIAAAVSLLLYRFCAFQLTLPRVIFPPDSLFNGAYYRNLLLERLRFPVVNYAYKEAAYVIFNRYANILGAVLTGVGVLCLTVMYRAVVRLWVGRFPAGGGNAL